MDNKRLKKSIGISFLMKPLSMFLSMVYTPLALAFLGDAKYGIWAIILNIISWINYFDIGVGNGLRNKLTEALTIGDKNRAKKYVSTAYVGTSLIAALFFIFFSLVWKPFGLSVFFRLTVPDENIDFIVNISVLLVCINFILALSKNSAYAIQKPEIISVVGVFGQTLQIGIIIILSRLLQQSLLAIVLMYSIVNILENVIIYCVITYRREYLRPSWPDIDLEYFKPLITLGAGFFVLQICSLVLNTTDNLLISYLYGTDAVTPYSIVYKVFYLIVQFHAILIMPLWSAYTEAATRKDMNWIKRTMKKVNLITLAFSLGAIAGIFSFKPLAKIWLGRELEYSTLLIVVVAIYMIVQMFGNHYSSFLCGVGHIKESVIISTIGAIMNIPLSVLFAQNFGLEKTGVIMGSLVVMLQSVFVLPMVTRKWKKQKALEWSE